MEQTSSNAAEMPFLDHLEELRWRIIWSLAALVVGVVAAFFVVFKFDLLSGSRGPSSRTCTGGGSCTPIRATASRS